MISGTARWYTVGGYLVTSVKTGLSVSVARSGQVPGEIAWDDCNCDGVLAVSVPRIFLAEVFPEEETGPGSAGGSSVACRAPYEVGEFTVAVLRCAPQPEGDALSPPATDLDTSAGLLLQDMAESLDALTKTLCALQDSDSISDYQVTPAEAAGPEGACVGFNLTVRVALERP